MRRAETPGPHMLSPPWQAALQLSKTMNEHSGKQADSSPPFLPRLGARNGLDIDLFFRDANSGKEPTLHSFNPYVAEAFQDVSTALVLNYIEHFSWSKDRVAYIYDEQDGTRHETDMPFYRYYALGLGDFTKHFPFLSRTKIRECLNRLIKGARIAYRDLRFVERKIEMIGYRANRKATQRYTYRVSENYWDYYKWQKHKLEENVANMVGVLPAAIFHNLRHTIFQQWEKAAEVADGDYLQTMDQACVFKSPKGWRGEDDDPPDKHPHRFSSLRTIVRAFERLENTGLLERMERRGRCNEPCWSIPKWAREQIAHRRMSIHPSYIGKTRIKTPNQNDL
jgi:hypothetical protein